MPLGINSFTYVNSARKSFEFLHAQSHRFEYWWLFWVEDMARTFAKPFYNSKEWEKIRKSVLMRDNYLCVKCGKPATEVHHKKHLTPENIMDASVSMDMDNLASLCRDCHFEEHREEMHSKRDEWNATHKRKYKKRSYAVREGLDFDENGQLIQVKAQ